LQGTEEVLVERGFGEGILVLKFGREVNAVVLADVADCLRRQLLGFGRYAHGIENVTTRSKIAGEGPIGNPRKFGQLTFADKPMTVVEVDHEILKKLKKLEEDKRR
jgi:hypothetical protein